MFLDGLVHSRSSAIFSRLPSTSYTRTRRMCVYSVCDVCGGEKSGKTFFIKFCKKIL